MGLRSFNLEKSTIGDFLEAARLIYDNAPALDLIFWEAYI